MNKTIYILWLQGFEKSPDVVKRCVSSWKYYNPDWNIILLDDMNLRNYVLLEDYVDISENQIEKCHLSDIIRCILLNNYGGLWTDATTFCNRPLNDWLPNYISQGFFAFEKPNIENVLLSNWFIYSEKDNYIINSWLKYTINYYTIHTKAHTYFIHHYLFGYLYSSDLKFKLLWDNVPKYPATGIGPHYLIKDDFFNEVTEHFKRDIITKITPLFKLSYKCVFPIYDENKKIFFIYSTIKL